LFFPEAAEKSKFGALGPNNRKTKKILTAHAIKVALRLLGTVSNLARFRFRAMALATTL
jgi:hypothetical protein